MNLDAPLSATSDAATPAAKPRGRPRKTLEEREDGNRKNELIAAAAKLFRKKGFDATSTRDIASAVGMRSGSPFYHFKSKGDLLYAVMAEGMRAAIEKQHNTLLNIEQQKQGPRRLLQALIHHHFEVLLGPNSDFIPVMLYEWRSLTPRQRTTMAKLQRDYEAVWLPVLEALFASGQLKCPVKLARLLMFGALNWSVQWFDAKKEA
ncbi:MAG: TetR/AcrR family transcriptional regulator, partial [Burkholderiaceae bacterium]|nr:TetR/AcrR family transcriptional regulator [Burkholderiaceae bacterium]